jgi:hypothetical protein
MAYRTVTQRCATIVQDEIICSGTPKPGHLVEIYNNSTVKTVRVHPTAGGNATAMFAVEDEFQGKDMADAYVAATQCIVRTFRAGDLVVVWIYANETIAIGTKLESQGDGTLRALDVDAASYSTADSWVATAEEALSGNTVDTKCLVRIR